MDLITSVLVSAAVLMVVLTESYPRWHRTWLPAFVLGLVTWINFAFVLVGSVYINFIHADDGRLTSSTKAITAVILVMGLVMVTADIRRNWKRRKLRSESNEEPPTPTSTTESDSQQSENE